MKEVELMTVVQMRFDDYWLLIELDWID